MSAEVSVVRCNSYDIEMVRQAVRVCLEPLGGLEKFVKPGMKVLLKPNLLGAAELDQAVTTNPAVVQVVAEMVLAAGGEVQVGDSPAGPISRNEYVWKKSGVAEAAQAAGAAMVKFENAAWKTVGGKNYFIARPVLDADLVINLPKLKTHSLTLYTGAVKNLFGTIPGTTKTEIHVRAPGVADFSKELVNVFELVRPGLTIMDGIVGLEGDGPGAGGTAHAYHCMAASTDPVALDAVMSQAMGFRQGDVRHLAQAGARGLGTSDPGKVNLFAEPGVLGFGVLKLPSFHWYMKIPSWVSAPVQRSIKLQPKVADVECIGCGLCSDVCPGKAIETGKPVTIDLDLCIGCMCCAEVCPQGAIHPQRGKLAKLFGITD